MNVNAIQIGKIQYLVVHGFIPIMLGASIYLLFRDSSLLVFDWVNAINLTDVLFEYRHQVAPYAPIFPSHVLYSLPDGCWVWGMTAIYRMIWNLDTRLGIFWISLGLVLGQGGEFGQLIGFVPGHFDWWDVLYMTIGFLIPLWHYQHIFAKSP